MIDEISAFPPKAGHFPKLNIIRNQLLHLTCEIEDWLKINVHDLPSDSFFLITVSANLLGFNCVVSGKNVERATLDIERLINHIEQHGKISYDRLMDFKI